MKDFNEKLRYMLITDRKNSRLPILEAIDQILAAGFTAIQLREPDLPASELVPLADKIKAIASKYNALFLINQYTVLPKILVADGAHLGWKSIPLKQARQILGEKMLIGFSAHNAEQLKTAIQQGANYATVSPVYPTPSKAGLIPVLGLKNFKAIALNSKIPIIGLGGINKTNVKEVLQAGADGIAVIRAVLDSNEPGEAARQLIKASKT